MTTTALVLTAPGLADIAIPSPQPTPRGAEARIAAATSAAMETALGALRRWQDQAEAGEPAPVIVVCTPDSEIGHGLITKYLGHRAPASLCGPAVFLLPVAELAAALARSGDQVAQAIAGLQAGSAPVWAFAVNRSQIQLRVLSHAPTPPTEPT